MSKILLLKAWTNKKSALVGVLALVFVLFWPSIPLRSVDLWLQTLSNLFPTIILYPILAFLVGSYASIYFYNKTIEKCCSVDGIKTGSSATLGGVLLGACPACIPVIAFFLPLSITITLSYFSWLFSIVAIFILLFVIYRMNGFKKFGR